MPDISILLPLVGALGFAGAVVGLLAGLFGIGGGAVSVPVFFEIFGWLGYPEAVRMPLAVGTSLAVIIPTSWVSARGHFLRGTVDMAVLRLWAAPIILGVLAGSVVARFAEPKLFQVVFIFVAGTISIKLLTGGRGWRSREALPSPAVLRIYGGIIGVLSALMGIGGGALSNMVLTLHGVPIRRAISTASGVGVLIALPGALGYMAAGWGKPGLPPDAIGYVSVLAFGLTIPATLVTTRLGVRLAHALPRRVLEIAFGLFLMSVSLRFVWDIL